MEELTIWDFVAKWYPDYHSSDEILHNDDLAKLVDGEYEEGDHSHDMLMKQYGGDINNPQIKIDFSLHNEYIYGKAIENFLSVRGID